MVVFKTVPPSLSEFYIEPNDGLLFYYIAISLNLPFVLSKNAVSTCALFQGAPLTP
jgi:hypothetical protein